MALHPSIHSDLTRHHELELRRRLARPGRAATKRPGTETPDGLVELVAAARAGDPQAWSSLVTRFTPMLRAVARDYRLSPADVDDVVQATWVAAFTHLAQVREPEAVSGWLCVTARRQALRTIKSRQREITVEEPRQPDQSEHPNFESSLVQQEERTAVHAAVERLPARQRSLITALFNGPTPNYQTVSTNLKIPPGSIGPTRDRALTRLRHDPRLTSALQPTHNTRS